MNWHWLKLVADLAPVVLQFVPGGAALAPIVALGVQTAEAIPGLTGPQKLAHAQQLVAVGVAATNQVAGKQLVDPAFVNTISAHVIGSVVQLANDIHAAHAPVAA